MLNFKKLYHNFTSTRLLTLSICFALYHHLRWYPSQKIKWVDNMKLYTILYLLNYLLSCKALNISEKLLPHKVLILIYDLSSSTITVPEAFAGNTSNAHRNWKFLTKPALFYDELTISYTTNTQNTIVDTMTTTNKKMACIRHQLISKQTANKSHRWYTPINASLFAILYYVDCQTSDIQTKQCSSHDSLPLCLKTLEMEWQCYWNIASALSRVQITILCMQKC